MEKRLVESKAMPSVDAWLAEAKADPQAKNVGMYLTHNGVVRETSKAKIRYGEENTKPVVGMVFSYDAEKAEEVIARTLEMPGIYYVRVWMAEGERKLGDSLMLVLIGADMRPHAVEALDYLMGRIKGECVKETEVY